MLLKKTTRERKEKIGHVLAAIIILVHALEKHELHEDSWLFFAISGIVFLGVAIMHHRIAKVFPYVDGVFFIIEAMLYAIIAAEYFHKGKKALPWCYVFATIAYTVSAFIRAKKGKAKHTHSNDPKINT